MPYFTLRKHPRQNYTKQPTIGLPKQPPPHKIAGIWQRAEYSPGLFREAVKACCIPLIYRIWCTQSPNFRASAVHKLKNKKLMWTWKHGYSKYHDVKHGKCTEYFLHPENIHCFAVHGHLALVSIFSIWRKPIKWNMWLQVSHDYVFKMWTPMLSSLMKSHL